MKREYLKRLRADKKLSQEDVAAMAEISGSYYAMMELGQRQRDMSYSMMERLATAFEVSVQSIVDHTNNRTAGGAEVPKHLARQQKIIVSLFGFCLARCAVVKYERGGKT